jgi:hypothetical protein
MVFGVHSGRVVTSNKPQIHSQAVPCPAVALGRLVSIPGRMLRAEPVPLFPSDCDDRTPWPWPPGGDGRRGYVLLCARRNRLEQAKVGIMVGGGVNNGGGGEVV